MERRAIYLWYCVPRHYVRVLHTSWASQKTDTAVFERSTATRFDEFDR